jgi:hypothetical protein
MSKTTTIINPWNGQPMEIPEGGEITPASVLAAAEGMTEQQKADMLAGIGAKPATDFAMPQNESVRAANIAVCANNRGGMMVYVESGSMANVQPFFVDGENHTVLLTTENDQISIVLPVNHDLQISSGFFIASDQNGIPSTPLPSVGCLDYRVTSVSEESTATSVSPDAILATFVALLPTYGDAKPFIDLTGLPAPSAQGMADVATLTAAGFTVLVHVATPEEEGYVEVPATGTPVTVLTVGEIVYKVARGVYDGETQTFSPSATGDLLIITWDDGVTWAAIAGSGPDQLYPSVATWTEINGFSAIPIGGSSTSYDGKTWVKGES